MDYFGFRITERYTAALLDLFNDLKIEYTNSDGSTEVKVVPIAFRSRTRALNLTASETAEIIKGNTSTLPRLSLVFNGLEKAYDRNTSKYITSHEIQTTNGKTLTLNSIPYNWSFSLMLITRTITEAVQIVEQVCPMFRPSYTLNLKEIPIQKEPTTVLLNLDASDIEINDDHENEDIRTVVTKFDFTLKGNMYLNLQDVSLIKDVRIYLNNIGDDGMYEKNVLIQDKVVNEDVVKNVIDLNPKTTEKDTSRLPQIIDILQYKDQPLPSTLNKGDTITLQAVIEDLDNIGDKFTYVWTTNIGLITTGDYIAYYDAIATGTATISLVVVDYHGNQTPVFQKDIEIN